MKTISFKTPEKEIVRYNFLVYYWGKITRTLEGCLFSKNTSYMAKVLYEELEKVIPDFKNISSESKANDSLAVSGISEPQTSIKLVDLPRIQGGAKLLKPILKWLLDLPSPGELKFEMYDSRKNVQYLFLVNHQKKSAKLLYKASKNLDKDFFDYSPEFFYEKPDYNEFINYLNTPSFKRQFKGMGNIEMQK